MEELIDLLRRHAPGAVVPISYNASHPTHGRFA